MRVQSPHKVICVHAVNCLSAKVSEKALPPDETQNGCAGFTR
jgi:hypothetical protein